MPITVEDDVLRGLPRIEGTRICVLHVYDAVITGGSTPAAVADALDVTLGQVYEALAYYYNNPDEMRRHRGRQASDRAELADRVVKPPVETSNSR